MSSAKPASSAGEQQKSIIIGLPSLQKRIPLFQTRGEIGGRVGQGEHVGGDCRAPEGASRRSAWDGSTGTWKPDQIYFGFTQISQVERLLEEGKETQGALTRQVFIEVFIAVIFCGIVYPNIFFHPFFTVGRIYV